ncbi:ParA family protein [Rhodococcus rhodnii]|uniref:ParA family protein n=1 Tax=Rhodococcus rhodnii TaxID=38312 RepID=UPI00093358E9|nr:ParA family protein [Rhodococcus rhodnii]
MIISLVNTKGGTAKTTSAIYLAAAYRRRGSDVVMLDLDKQGSATDWADRAAESGDPLPFKVEVANMKRLAKYTARAGTIVIIDTPPGDGQVIDAAIAASDFVILPTQATGLDTARVWETLPSIQGRLPFGVLITAARLGTKLLYEAKEVFDANDVPRFDTVIPMKERVRSTFGTTPHHDEGYSDVVREIEESLA